MARATAPEHTSTRLQQCEDIIETAERWDIERAKALLRIKRLRLWEGSGYENFDHYAATRWHYDGSYAYRLTEWAETLEQLPIGSKKPERESIARPLYGIDVEAKREIWHEVIKRSGSKITAKLVETITKEHLSRKTQQKPSQTAPRVSGSVIVAHAVDGLNTLADGSIGLLCFSPPYAEQRDKDYPSIPEKEFPAFMVKVLSAARPKMAPDGNILINAREHVEKGTISDYLLRMRLALRESGLFEIDTIIWHKPDAPPLGRADRPRRAYEFIYWFAYTRNPFIDTRACGTPPVEPRTRMIRTRTNKSKQHGQQPFMRFTGDILARCTDVIFASHGTASADIQHPTPYPVALTDQLVKTYSRVDSLVVDCFCGSGTTLVSAKANGRNYFGCDLVPKYVEEAKARLDRTAEP